MAEPIDWMQYAEKPSAQTDWMQYAEIEPEATGWSGIGQDIWQGIKNAPGRAFDILGQTVSGLINPHDTNLLDPYKIQELKRQKAGEIPYESALTNPKILAASLATGTRNIGNVPANIVDYLHRKEVAPSWLSAWELPEDIKNFDYYQALGVSPQTQGQQLLAGLGESIPGMAITGGKLGGYPALATSAIGANRNPIEDMLAAWFANKSMRAVKEAPQVTSKGYGKLSDIAKGLKPKMFEKAAGLETATTELGKLAEESRSHLGLSEKAAANEYAKNLEGLIQTEEMALGEKGRRESALQAGQVQLENTKRQLAENLSSEKNNLIEAENNLIQNLTSKTPLNEAENHENLRNVQTAAYETLNQQFNKEYEDFYNAPSGYRAEQKTAPTNQAEAIAQAFLEMNKPSNISHTIGGELIDNPAEVANINQQYADGLAYSGKNTREQINTLIENPTIKNLIDVRRAITSEKAMASSDSVNQQIAKADRDAAASASNDLKQLESKLENITKQVLTDEAYQKLKDIDKRYGQYVKPFYKYPVLRTSISPYEPFAPNNFFNQFNELGKSARPLLDLLMQNPEWQQAVAQNDLMGTDWSKPANVIKVMQGDFGKMLPQSLSSSIRNLEQIQTSKKNVISSEKQINMNELRAIVTEPDMLRALAKHPEITRLLDDARTQAKGLEKLEKSLKKAGDNAKIASQKVNELKNAWAKISSSNEIKNIINDPVVSRIFDQHPDLLGKIQNLQTQRMATQALEKYLEKTGLSAKEAKAKADTIKDRIKTVGYTSATLLFGKTIISLIGKLI